jgi:hypothetical protein
MGEQRRPLLDTGEINRLKNLADVSTLARRLAMATRATSSPRPSVPCHRGGCWCEDDDVEDTMVVEEARDRRRRSDGDEVRESATTDERKKTRGIGRRRHVL